jgi:hypothetical protein
MEDNTATAIRAATPSKSGFMGPVSPPYNILIVKLNRKLATIAAPTPYQTTRVREGR